jgi:hypothetical protein
MTDDELRAWIANRMERTKHSVRQVVKKTVVKFEAPDRTDWRSQALAMLSEFTDKKAWAAAYLSCGRCYRGFIEWLEQNPVGEGWLEKAQKIILENRWI